MEIQALKKLISFLQRLIDLQDKEPRRLSSRAFLASKTRAQASSSGWFDATCKWMERWGTSMDDLTNNTKKLLSEELHQRYLDLRWEDLRLTWIRGISLEDRKGERCRRYRVIINPSITMEPSPYLSAPMPTKARQALGRFRCGSHRLAIETLKWKQIPRDRRFCEHCDLQEVDDEEHYLFRCRFHVAARADFLDLFQSGLQSVSVFLASQDQKRVGMYVSRLVQIREAVLED